MVCIWKPWNSIPTWESLVVRIFLSLMMLITHEIGIPIKEPVLVMGWSVVDDETLETVVELPYDGDSYIHNSFQWNCHTHSHVRFSRYVGFRFSSTKSEQNSVKITAWAWAIQLVSSHPFGCLYFLGAQNLLLILVLVNGLRDVVVGDPFLI